MKKFGLDEDVDYSKRDEIEKTYENFEKEIKDNYFKKPFSFLNLLNPFNYFGYEDYSSAYNSDKNSCFFSKYLKEIEEIERHEIKTDSEKNNLIKVVTETTDKLKDDLQTSLEAMYSTISNLNNTLSEEVNEHYDDCQNNIKYKIEVMGKIQEGLMESRQIIENFKGNEKLVLTLKEFVNISKITKNIDVIQYFISSLNIYGYYKIDIEVKKDWWGIFFTIVLGALEIIGGCCLLYFTGGQFGSELIEEGYSDIKYGVECLIGKKTFSWSELKKKKINYLIQTAVKIALKLLTGGFSSISKSKLINGGLKNVFKQVGKKLLKQAAKEVGMGVLTYFIGPELKEKIISKVKKVLREGVVKYFGNEIKKK